MRASCSFVVTCLTRVSLEFHQRFTRVSPEFRQSFARISHWSTSKKGMTTTQPSHMGQVFLASLPNDEKTSWVSPLARLYPWLASAWKGQYTQCDSIGSNLTEPNVLQLHGEETYLAQPPSTKPPLLPGTKHALKRPALKRRAPMGRYICASNVNNAYGSRQGCLLLGACAHQCMFGSI